MLQSFRLSLYLFNCYTLMPSQEGKVRPLLNGNSSNIHISASDVSPESPSMDKTGRLEILKKCGIRTDNLSILPSVSEKPWPLTMSDFMCFQWDEVWILLSWQKWSSKALKAGERAFVVCSDSLNVCLQSYYFIVLTESLLGPSPSPEIPEFHKNGQNLHFMFIRELHKTKRIS